MITSKRTPLVFSLCFTVLGISSFVSAASIEYLPGTKWDTPPVVDSGETNSDAPADATILFDGTDRSEWSGGDSWKVENGELVCGGGDIQTKQQFGDCQLHVEWSAPTSVHANGQGRSNSGIFLMGLFEVQVLDSYNNPTYADGQAGAIYKQTPPMVNVTRKPGEWNTYDIFWTCPEMGEDDKTITKSGYVTVVHNGVLIVNHHEVAGNTFWYKPPAYEGLGSKDEQGRLVGPIKLQDHGNPVRYRNIWIRDLNAPTGNPRQPMYIDHSTGKKTAAE